MAAANRRLVQTKPDRLTAVPASAWPPNRYGGGDNTRVAVFLSKSYLVQVFSEKNMVVGGEARMVMRMTVNRTEIQKNGRWKEDITWEELQLIKSQVGFGDKQAVEIYPAEIDVVNVANMRHLWIFDAALPLGWFANYVAATEPR